MLQLSRAVLRRLRAVLRKSVLEQPPRGEWPLLWCQGDRTGLTVQASRGDMGLTYHQPGPCAPETFVFRSDCLAECEGRTDEPVTLEEHSTQQARLSWRNTGVPRQVMVELVSPDSLLRLPSPPRLVAQPPELVQALAAATEVTGKEAGRFALTHLQLSGKSGAVQATDGKQLLSWGGFRFPWRDELLVPRVGAFGLRELQGEKQIAVGRTETAVYLRVGPWLFTLAIDTSSRFPNLQSVIPRPASTGAHLHLTQKEAALLLRTLPKLPEQEDDTSITLDLHPPVAIRAGSGTEVTQVELPGCNVSGPPIRVVLHREHLLQALGLGLHELYLNGPSTPMLCQRGPVQYVAMSLDPKTALESSATVQRLTPDQPSSVSRRISMPPRNGRTRIPERPESGRFDPAQLDLSQLITEAEALRTQLLDSSQRLERLITGLQAHQNNSQAVQNALKSLQQLSRLTPFPSP